MDQRSGERRQTRLQMTRYHHSGVRPVRVLLVGDRVDLTADVRGTTLAERIADRIWLSTRHGVDVDVLTDLAPVLRAVQGVFQTWRLWRYDVVAVVLGEHLDGAQRPRTLARVGDLLEEVLADAAGATDVVVLGVGGGRGRHGGPSGTRLQQIVAGLGSDRVRFHPVAPVADPLERIRVWAAAAAEEVAASLALGDRAGSAAALRTLPDEEAARQQALDELGVVGRPPDPRLDDLVELARTAFGAASAEINFIDRDRQWKMAVAGADREPNPRAHSFCTYTIQRAEPTVVGDARSDPRFRSTPMVQGPDAVRFYAAYPIESMEGYRIGSFCVYDPEPRDVEGLDLAVLRDLALLAQAEIVAADLPPQRLSPQLAGGR